MGCAIYDGSLIQFSGKTHIELAEQEDVEGASAKER